MKINYILQLGSKKINHLEEQKKQYKKISFDHIVDRLF